jgi:hypothetical protein
MHYPEVLREQRVNTSAELADCGTTEVVYNVIAKKGHLARAAIVAARPHHAMSKHSRILWMPRYFSSLAHAAGISSCFAMSAMV